MKNRANKFTTETIGKHAWTTALEFDGNNNPIYIGLALPGTLKSSPSWIIRKLLFDANNNVTDILYANGSRNFDQIWDNRASLSYS